MLVIKKSILTDLLLAEFFKAYFVALGGENCTIIRSTPPESYIKEIARKAPGEKTRLVLGGGAGVHFFSGLDIETLDAHYVGIHFFSRTEKKETWGKFEELVNAELIRILKLNGVAIRFNWKNNQTVLFSDATPK